MFNNLLCWWLCCVLHINHKSMRVTVIFACSLSWEKHIDSHISLCFTENIGSVVTHIHLGHNSKTNITKHNYYVSFCYCIVTKRVICRPSRFMWKFNKSFPHNIFHDMIRISTGQVNWQNMMTSSNGNIFRVTGHMWENPRVTSGLPSCTKVSNAEHWCFLWTAPKYAVEQPFETPVIWDAIALIITSL